MKRIFLITFAFIATVITMAQNIAVVSPSNKTTIYQTLDEAITGAEDGSIIYLPGGGFQIKDETMIDKKLTIMGVSHRGDTDNVDGATMIAGNLNFIEGSSESAIIGLYVYGNINIGTEEASVSNIVVKYCNLNSIQVKNADCSGIIINQSYVRSNSNFGNSNANITNCITACIENVVGGTILYNMVLGVTRIYLKEGIYANFCMWNIKNTNITGNFCLGEGFIRQRSDVLKVAVDNCSGSNNYNTNWGDDPIVIDGNASDFFVNWNEGKISPASNFHFKAPYSDYENKVGIYAGSSFKDSTSLAPIPRIVSKKIDEQTDGSGKLHIEVTIKAK